MLGKSHSGVLSQREKSLLHKAGITIPATEVLLYPSLCLPTNTVVVARSQSRTTKRDNSCLLYTDKELQHCWGLLEKIFAFSNSEVLGCYCLISILSPVCCQLCTDDVTHAELQDHLVACQPPRLVIFVET